MHDYDTDSLTIPGKKPFCVTLRGVCERHPQEGDVVYFGGVERMTTDDDSAMAAAMARVTEKIRALVERPGAVGGAVYADQLSVEMVMTWEHGTDAGLLLWRVPFREA
jgi:hypothetical protein